MRAFHLYVKRDLPFSLIEIKIREADDYGLKRISEDMGLELNIEEMRKVKEYYVRAERNATDVELQTLGQTWSEHCYHKTFKGTIITERGTVRNLLKSYIARATRELNPEWCISVFEDNAGIIEFDNENAIAVKVETHNHPSAVEPFGGAATGTGGVIRDILGVWADPIACMDVLCFGPLNLDYKALPPGVKHPKYLFKGVVAGIGAYGNNMGIPTLNGAIYFDEGYVGNVVVYCGCVGILPKEAYVKKTKPGDVALLAGGRTGRDGIHGVTFASAELTEESEETSRSAVQIPNPFEEEKLKRAILQVRDRRLASGITDLGGGGLSSAIGETAHKFGCGVEVDLSKVPLKQSNLAPWEIWVSESQERMLLTVPPENLERVLAIFEEEEVEAASIGRFTRDNKLKILYEEVEVADLEIEFLFQPPIAIRKAEWNLISSSEPDITELEPLDSDLIRLLSSPNIGSRESIIRTYDYEVKGATVIKPLQGEHGGPNDAAVIKPIPNSWKGLAISCGFNPNYGKVDPYWMAASAIDEAIRNNVAVGGRRIALLDNFTWGNPEKPGRMGKLLRAVEACYRFAKAFRTPFISGKDSLYNESPSGPVTPTLLITAVGVLPDIRYAVTSDLKRSGNSIYIIGETKSELGGSEYYRLRGLQGGEAPKVDPIRAPVIIRKVTEAINCGYVEACHDLSEGGLSVTLAEMALGGNLGAELYLSSVPAVNVSRDYQILFSESNTRFLLEVAENSRRKLESLLEGVAFSRIGVVTKERRLLIHGLRGDLVVDVEVSVLRDAWKRGLDG